MDSERIPTMPQTSEERIPTMPQTGEERIPTMPQMDGERIPIMPQGGSERIPTMPQGTSDGHIPTMPQNQMDANGHIATMPQQGEQQSNIVGGRILLNSDVNFTGDKGGSFIIEAQNIVSADSGESQIYHCHRLVGDEKLVARVLISITPESDADKRATRDKVIRFLDNVSGNADSHILPLLDHGVIDVNGKKHYVEIYPFCEGGDLGTRKGKISYQELKDEIIPAINNALHYFHNAGLVHRDVKPDNLYKYNGRVVIGDFGITCDLREDGFATDKYKTGTLGYYAPELMSQAAIKASDYYSFGQTIWTLYSGEMMYGNILRRYKDFGIEEQRNQVNFSMLSNTYYGLDEIRKSDEFFEIIIRGLLQYDVTYRFNYEKVNRWLNGDKSIAHEIPNYDSAKTFTRALRLFGEECWDDADVSKVLSEHWDEAIEALYDGVLKDFYSSQTYEHARFLDGIMKTYTSNPDENMVPLANNVGLAKTIMYLSKNKMLCWRGSIYRKLSDISDSLEACINSGALDNDYYGLIASDLISEWYSNMPNQQDEVIDALNSVSEMLRGSDVGSKVALYWLFYLFTEDRDKLQFAGAKDFKSYINYLTSNKALIYGNNSHIEDINNTQLMGLLCAWGYEEAVKLFIDAYNNDYSSRYELFFDVMDKEVTEENDKKALYKLYCEYGPKSYLTWWKNHINEYKFVGQSSLSIKRGIEAVELRETDNLATQREAFAKLDALSNQFNNLMQADIFMGYVGIEGLSDEYIFSDKLSNAWMYEFLGQTAPLGFKAYLGL